MSYFRTFANPATDLQSPAGVAVVMATICRPSLVQALESIYAQTYSGTIQVLIGVDVELGSSEIIESVCRRAPKNCVIQIFYPGYSTSAWNGGIHPAGSGGVLRSVLTYLANSPYVAYLDDDNWWEPNHLSTLLQAVRHGDWAYSLRWFVHPESRKPVCVDEWESVGPDRGVFAEKAGGFVDPNTLMVNKLKCFDALHWWSVPLQGEQKGRGSDRLVFHVLRSRFRSVGTNLPTCNYVIDPNDGMHPFRLQKMGDAYLAVQG